MLEDDDDDDEIEALDNEGVGDELEDDDEVRILHFLLKSHVSQSKTNVKVMPAESNDNEPGVVNAESTREEVLNNFIGITGVLYMTVLALSAHGLDNNSEPMCILNSPP